MTTNGIGKAGLRSHELPNGNGLSEINVFENLICFPIP